jgi:ABC-type branched-subunit amino acid transport system ATPase component
MLLEIKDLHAFYEESHVLRGISLDVDHMSLCSGETVSARVPH